MPRSIVQLVVKIGGGLLAHAAHLDAVLACVAATAVDRRLLVVPGGGPFTEAVRNVDRQIGLSDDTAHWMAVLGMDQYAHLIASRLRGAVLVTDRDRISAATRDGQIPVLAPFEWLRRDDPLPHSWQVTSDSIAAWVAAAIGARRLILVKPPGSGQSPDIVDADFARVRTTLDVEFIPADRIDALRPTMQR